MTLFVVRDDGDRPTAKGWPSTKTPDAIPERPSANRAFSYSLAARVIRGLKTNLYTPTMAWLNQGDTWMPPLRQQWLFHAVMQGRCRP